MRRRKGVFSNENQNREKFSIKIYDIFTGLLVAKATYGCGPGCRWVEKKNLEKMSCVSL